MSKIYKIHPGIGIGRIGNSQSGFFIGPESLDRPPQEINNGIESALKKYKDSSGRIKRQGVRFRVYEYEQDAAGNLSSPREILAPEARIEWKVELANSKSAAPQLKGRPDANGLPLTTPLRNGNLPATDLIISPTFAPIAGVNQRVTADPEGKFLGKSVFLGDLHTDSEGRLIVLGGRGISASVPAGRDIDDFADNPLWHDDVSDGPISATITFPGRPTENVDKSAWVIFGPPDFAPGVKGITSLYDIAFQAAVTRGWFKAAATPSFRRDILPILRRASNLRWVNNFDVWDGISRNEKAISDLSTPATADANAPLRQTVFRSLMEIGPKRRLQDFRFTNVQTKYLEQWRDGDFVDDFDGGSVPILDISPENLDRSTLENTVGGGFFPGIEAGIKMTYPAIYDEPFRLTRETFQHLTFRETLRAGSMSERMAVPWQADFKACAGNWWPAQRPDEVITDPNQSIPLEQWDRGAEGFEGMVSSFSRLGFIVEAKKDGNSIFIETERDPML